MTYTPEQVAEAVTKLSKGRRPYPGIDTWNLARRWLDTSDLRRELPGLKVAEARRAVSAKLIAGDHDNPGPAGVVRFATHELAAAIAAEAGLTDAERAERTTAAVRALYAENLARPNDNPRCWGVSRQLAAVPQDGISLALTAGMIRSGDGGDLVPAEAWEVYSDAVDTYKRHQAALAERAENAAKRLALIGGHGRYHNSRTAPSVTLSLADAEAILARLEQLAEAPR